MDADLATLRELQARGRWAASESSSVALLGRLESGPAPDSLALAEVLHRNALAWFTRGALVDSVVPRRLERALAIRRRLLPAGADPIGESQLLLARIHLNAGRPDVAAAQLGELIDSRRPRVPPTDTLMAEAWRALGTTYRDRREFPGAIAAYDSAIAWRSRGYGEDKFVALALAEIGWCHSRLGNLDLARDTQMRSLGMIRSAYGPDDFAATAPLGYLAEVARTEGHLVQGMDYLQEAIRIARLRYRDDEFEVARLRRNLSNVLVALGDYSGAVALLERVLPVYQASFGANHWRVANLKFSIGNAKVAAVDSGGLRELRETEAFYAARPGPPDPELMRVLHARGSLLFELGRFREALETAERGIELAAKTPRPLRLIQGQLLMLRTQSLVELREVAAVGPAREEMMRYGREHEIDHSRLSDVLAHADAQALHCLGREDEAWARALEAEAIAREDSRRIARSESDDRAVINASRLAPLLYYVFDLARFGGRERLQIAWDRCIRNRGLVRAEVERRRLPPELRGDSEVVGAHERWLAAQRALARAATESGAGRDSAGRVALERLRAEAAETERTYARILSDHRGALPASEPGLADVLARLAPASALVSFVETYAGTDSAATLALVARGGRPGFESVKLGRSSALTAAVEAWRRELAASPAASGRGNDAERACRRLGEAVRRLTWDRVAPALADAEDVYLVPDGPLLELSWQALPVARGRYLVEEGPRLHVLLAERDLVSPRPAAGTPSLLALGSPDFGLAVHATPAKAETNRSAPDPCAGGAPDFGPIPGTLAEVNEIASAWRGAGAAVRELVGAKASETAFRRDAPGRSVVHVATHGIVVGDRCAEPVAGLRGVGGVAELGRATPAAKATRRPPAAGAAVAVPSPRRTESPWSGRRTWLALAGAQSASEYLGEDDGRLTAEEVVTLDLSGTDWVVLSACHSALGEGWSREGSMGMRRAFALAGARTVIASGWAVEDDATRAWMAELHRARAGGAGTAEAIASASRAVLRARRAKGGTTHPFYWAAFAASGE